MINAAVRLARVDQGTFSPEKLHKFKMYQTLTFEPKAIQLPSHLIGYLNST